MKNVFDNDFDALLRRIKFVQDWEATSMFVGFYLFIFFGLYSQKIDCDVNLLLF